jgi:predicted nucleic-acid-binding Zn-ribbon protein
MKKTKYQCPKCSNTVCEIDMIQTTGGFWTKFFNIQNKRFTTVTCTKCKFTELYKGTSSRGENILDFFGN